MRPDGTGLRQLTSFQSFNFRYEGDIFALPDDHATVSPDGKRVLFSSSWSDDNGVLGGIVDSDNYEVFIMNINGTNLRRLTNSPGFDGEAVFSPDGTKIAYVSECGGETASQCVLHESIYIMDPNGNILQRVTSSSFSDVEPAWHPDGTKVAYTRVTVEGGPKVGDEQKHIRITDADGLNKNDRLLFDALVPCLASSLTEAT
ncbi:MAG: hypothetical protein FJ147_24435 [Deltaproteobacteria bacterium]|nr:hypothetical protein [Deltaproteobacteria bacterium]